MKKITYFLITFLLLNFISYAQLATISQCTGGGIGSTTYGPMYSTTTANSNNRTVVIYPASQLTGIAGQTLTNVYFNRFGTTQTFPMVGTPNFKIYFKLSTAADLGATALDWATQITSATLVYDSNPTTIVGTSPGWKSFPLLSNFVFPSGQSLIVFMEYSNPVAQTASLNWDYEYTAPCVVTTNSNTTKYNNNTTGTLSAVTTSTNYRRPAIAFDFLVSCNSPLSSSVAVAGITTTSANLSWTAPSIAPANGYEYYVSTSNIAPLATSTATGSTVTGVTTASLTGLMSATQYYVWVRSVCGSTDKSIWVGGTSFTTLCVPITTLPWNEDFESIPTASLGTTTFPSCWTKENGDWSSSNATTYNTPRSGLNYLRDAWSAINEYMWTPPFQLTAGTSYDFSTFVQGDGFSGWTVDMYTNTTANSSGATAIGSQYVAPPLTGGSASIQPYALMKNTFIPTTTGTYYFAVKINQPSGAPWYLAFDDFKLEVTPSCAVPTALIASAITTSSANIAWTAPSSAPANGYQYYVSTTNTTPLTTATPTGSVAAGITNVTITALTAATNYYVWVRSACSAGTTSSWSSSSVTFNTTPVPGCATVISPANGATNVAAGTVTFSWSAPTTGGTATSYDLYTGSTPTTVTTLIGNFTTTSTQLSINVYSTLIYWLIVPKNAGGSAIGCTNLSFTTQAPPGYCLASTLGLYPATYTPATCDGTTNNVITTIGYAGEYSEVNVTVGNGYQFKSSIATDFITISKDNGVTAAVYGVTPVTYVPTVSGVVRFYNHTDNQCNNQSTSRTRSVVCGAALNNTAFDNESFSYYPNPVVDVLSLGYSKDISIVSVINLLGQEVLLKSINSNQTQVDMASLPTGTYLVKVTSDSLTKTIKVNKL